MKWNPEWQTRASIVTFGRAAGIMVILVGIGLSAWNVLDFGDIGFRGGNDVKIRYFLQSVLSYVASGGLLVLAAEVADRLGWGEVSSEQDADDEQQVGPPA